MNKLLAVLIVLLALTPRTAFEMEYSVKYVEINGQTAINGLTMVGKIESGDYSKLIAFFTANERAFVGASTFYLDSPGGNVGEALRIGKLVAETFRTTLVEANAKCLSACFLIFVSGAQRIPEGNATIGIHRPYYEKSKFAKLSQQQAREEYEKLDNEVRQFLARAKIADRLVEKMFSVPSDSVFKLSPDILASEVGLTQPWWEEMEIAACGAGGYKKARYATRKDMLMALDAETLTVGECMNQISFKERKRAMPKYLRNAKP